MDWEADKIIFAGPVGAGKSTAIQLLSEIPVVSTDVLATDNVAKDKETTTVGMDYGQITLDSGEVIRLCGTPGQERFNHMWSILALGGIGLILLLDVRRQSLVEDLLLYLHSFQRLIADTGLVIGLTHTDQVEKDAFFIVDATLSANDCVAPILEVDVRDGEQVRQLVMMLLAVLEAEI